MLLSVGWYHLQASGLVPTVLHLDHSPTDLTRKLPKPPPCYCTRTAGNSYPQEVCSFCCASLGHSLFDFWRLLHKPLTSLPTTAIFRPFWDVLLQNGRETTSLSPLWALLYMLHSRVAWPYYSSIWLYKYIGLCVQDKHPALSGSWLRWVQVKPT